MRSLMIFALAPILTGCMTAQQQAFNQTRSEVSAGLARCSELYRGAAQAVERSRCQNEAEQPLRATAPYPDLFDQRWTGRSAIAERIQSGKITIAEGNAEFSRLSSDLISEEQRRAQGARSVAAQESAARANAIMGAAAIMTASQPSAPRPINCNSTRLYNTVNTTCY